MPHASPSIVFPARTLPVTDTSFPDEDRISLYSVIRILEIAKKVFLNKALELFKAYAVMK